MATESKNFFGGMLGNAEDSLKSRKSRLESEETKALDRTTNTEEDGIRAEAYKRKLRNEQAAEGKTRLTTEDKRY